MHRFLHGIRRSSYWPVASPLAIVRLTCPLPGYGDLLPSGDEEEDGDLLPYSGANQDGDLPPYSGANQDGDLLPQSGDENQQNISTLVDVEYTNLQALHGDDAGLLLPRSGVHQHFSWTFVPAINAWVLPTPRPRVKMKCALPLYTVHAWEHDAWACPASPPPSSILLILFNVRLHAKLLDPPVTLTPLRESLHGEDVAALYDCSLWLNSSNGKLGAEAYFLIPLRGSISMQWNDEDFNEDVAALKMKTKRSMMVMLLYLMKDLLDPG